MRSLSQLFEDMNSLHVAIVGDVMLDNYWWGDVERISPEAPVPVVALKHRESRLGGAANVALNARALGARVSLCTVIGADTEGDTLSNLATESGIGMQASLRSSQRATTTKTRVMARHQQMLRLDDEQADELFPEEEHPFIDLVLRFLQREKPQVLIFEDYNKGVLKENVIRRITDHCREIGILTAVDPKKKNFLSFHGVDIFKPNLKEVREGLNVNLDTPNLNLLEIAHQKLHEALGHQITFITLSELGVFAQKTGETPFIIPSHLRNIADVSGAGDTVIATAAMVFAQTRDLRLMAEISNIAGGLVCEELGVVPISKDRLLTECQSILEGEVKIQ
ncbi:MAG: carbohydrate kinase [Bacteroidetes bacterium]|nr:carbohydrate kinase [Bacteroidota bacterium]MBS1628938.1 carbohydrate kinase [Bacteroidota bacterium]